MSVSRFASATFARLAFSQLWSNAATTDASVGVVIASLRNTKDDIGCLIFNCLYGYPET
jgi:uncharacterized protein (DUF2141 family)